MMRKKTKRMTAMMMTRKMKMTMMMINKQFNYMIVVKSCFHVGKRPRLPLLSSIVEHLVVHLELHLRRIY